MLYPPDNNSGNVSQPNDEEDVNDEDDNHGYIDSDDEDILVPVSRKDIVSTVDLAHLGSKSHRLSSSSPATEQSDYESTSEKENVSWINVPYIRSDDSKYDRNDARDDFDDMPPLDDVVRQGDEEILAPHWQKKKT